MTNYEKIHSEIHGLKFLVIGEVGLTAQRKICYICYCNDLQTLDLIYLIY